MTARSSSPNRTNTLTKGSIRTQVNLVYGNCNRMSLLAGNVVTPTCHTLSLWSAICCLLVSSAVSIASRLALAAKLLLQTITKDLNLQCATRRGFCEICSLLGRHGSDSLCRDERENKMAATYNVLAFKR